MRRQANKLFCTLAVLVLSGFTALPAHAGIYTFSQDGYPSGGVITGWFDAIDIISNGQISSFDGEVFDFFLSFSGDSLVADFTHGFPDLEGLVYDIGSGFLGDGAGGDIEGIESFDADFYYASGLGPFVFPGGEVWDASEQMVFTDNLIVVTDPVAVPVPWAIWLSCSGLVTCWRLRQRKAV